MDMSISDVAWVAMNDHGNKTQNAYSYKPKTQTTNNPLWEHHLDHADKMFSLSLGVGHNTDIFA